MRTAMHSAVRALLERVKGKVDEADFAARVEKARAGVPLAMVRHGM